MSAFTTSFLFLRDPHGGVEDLGAMWQAGFHGVFVNTGDFGAGEWEQVVRPRALALGMFCGPWARVETNGAFSETKLAALLGVAQDWASPVIVNAESELKRTGGEVTALIADRCRSFDAALSMEPWPFADVDWFHLNPMPVLPQMFDGWKDTVVVRDQWWAYGVKCVYPTFGTFGGMQPADYVLNAPFSLYTADDCGGNYQRWAPTQASYNGCVQNGVKMAGVASSCVEAWQAFEQASVLNQWRADNPGEWAKLEAYWNAPPGTPIPAGIRSKTGVGLLGLAEAKKYGDGTHG